MPKTSRAKVSRISNLQTGHRGCFSAGMSIRRKPHSGQTESIGASHFGQMCGVEIDFPVFPSCSLILKSHAELEHNARGGIACPPWKWLAAGTLYKGHLSQLRCGKVRPGCPTRKLLYDLISYVVKGI